ncbi:MAG: hypothetical protein ACLPND_25190 [Candidatus Korobacteraceae bacterium]
MENDVKDIEPRPLTEREAAWILEILQTSDTWKTTDVSRTQVVAEGPCDEGLSILLRAPEPENSNPSEKAGYIGRICIINDDDSYIEVRLTHLEGRLHELFVLFVDPEHPNRPLPASWTEVSHEAFGI